jgi:Flp pilus assembly protein CpaB
MEIQRHRGLPGGRAVLGGVLMAVAAVGVFVAYDQANREPTDPIVVAAGTIRVGQVLEAGDLRTVDGELPDDVADAAFATEDELVGRIALGPVAEGEIVQRASVTDQKAGDAAHEVAVSLPRRQVAVGRLKLGERVDVFVTYDERTSSVVRGARVVQIDAEDSGSLTSDRDVTLVVAVPDGDAVAALVHALRTGDVTVVRSTFADTTAAEPAEYEGAGATTTTPADRDAEG